MSNIIDQKEDSFVLPVRKGGLGNQMFQVAAAMIYEITTGRKIILPRELPHVHNTFNQEYANTVFSWIEHKIDTSINQIDIFHLTRSGFKLHVESPGFEPGFERWSPKMDLEGNVILHGYFQHYPSLKPYENIIRDRYTSTLSQLLDSDSKPSSTRVGIHIRRGDYLQFHQVHYNLDDTYYRKAIDEIQKHNSNITEYHIFSDDIEWCKEQPVFNTLRNVSFIDEKDECKCLALMTLCHGGFICANSTYSWWAAFLGPHKVKAPCVVPSTWFRGENVDLFPSEWIII